MYVSSHLIVRIIWHISIESFSYCFNVCSEGVLYVGRVGPEVLFSCDRCCFDVFAVSVDYATCFVSLIV